MTSVSETPGPRKIYERALRRTAERQQMRLVRSARRDPPWVIYHNVEVEDPGPKTAGDETISQE